MCRGKHSASGVLYKYAYNCAYIIKRDIVAHLVYCVIEFYSSPYTQHQYIQLEPTLKEHKGNYSVNVVISTISMAIVQI